MIRLIQSIRSCIYVKQTDLHAGGVWSPIACNEPRLSVRNPPDPIKSPALATSGILRPFVPSRDFELSREFYSAIGFQVRRKSEQIALISLGDADTGVSFLLQDFYVPALAENLMLQIVVPNLSVWWNHLASLQLYKRFSVKPPKPPAREEWGGDVAYFWDPAGVLWHVVSLEGGPS